MAARKGGQDTVAGNETRDVVVIGGRDRLAIRLEGALKGRPFRFVYRPTPDDVLPVPEVAPAFYVVNFLADLSPAGQGRGRRASWANRCLQVVGDLARCVPAVPVLIAADESRQRAVIESALACGATEVIGADGSRISTLVASRIDRVLAAFPSRAGVTAPPAAATGGTRGGGPDPRWTEGDSWEDSVPASEAAAALARVREQATSLPTPSQRAQPLAGILDIATPELRAPSGRLDAQRVAERLGISLRQLAKAAGVTHQALSATPDSKAAQPGLDAIARALATLDTLLPKARARDWLNAPHTRLQGATPLEALLDGRAERVASMLGVVREGGVA